MYAGAVDKSASRTLVSPADGEGAFLIQYQTPGSIVRGDYMSVYLPGKTFRHLG